MNFDLGNIIELVLIAAALVGIYVKLQVKMKELEMKLIALEARVQHVEKQDEKIMDKLDEMSNDIRDSLLEIKLELQQKQNK